MQTDVIEILLVEDNPGDVYLVRESFKMGSIPKHISVVEDGEAALDYLYQRGRYSNATPPDLILLDLNLPKLDGMEVLEVIKVDPKLRYIPTLVLTTSKAEKDVLMAYDHHANCYLTKPGDLLQYLDMMQEIEQYWLSMVCLPA